MNMFGNNASDNPVMIKKIARDGKDTYCTTVMPSLDMQHWQDDVRKSTVYPRRFAIVDNGNVYISFGISEQQLQNYISYGKKPAGTAVYEDSQFMRNLYGIFENKCK